MEISDHDSLLSDRIPDHSLGSKESPSDEEGNPKVRLIALCSYHPPVSELPPISPYTIRSYYQPSYYQPASLTSLSLDPHKDKDAMLKDSSTPAPPSYLPTSPSYLPTSPSYLPTSPSYSPSSPSYSPTSLTNTRKTCSSVNASAFVFPSDEEWSVELRRRAKIALEYYNGKNGTAYELSDVLKSKGILCEGFWMHFNFTTKPSSGSIDGDSSKLFFAEILGLANAENATWTATACHILSDGKTTDGCKFCSDIIHPTHGFSQGTTKRAHTKRYPSVNTVPRSLSYVEKRNRRAEMALDFYNRENGTNYELLDVIIISSFESNGTWNHYNFMGKKDVDGKYIREFFFAEIQITCCPTTETLTVTACHILESGKNTPGCGMCTDVLHPTYGFLKGLKDSSTPAPPSYLPTSPSYSPTSLTKTRETYPVNTSMFAFPSDEQWSHELRRRAEIALQYYNKKNGANYEIVDVLNSKGIYCDGFWMHCNFSAKPPKGDTESPLSLFFAEIVAADDTNNPEAVIWTASACHILDGKTTDGCLFCSGIIHPTHGFNQGIARAKITPGNTIPWALPSIEKRLRRAEIAIEYYNKINSTSYELLHVILSKGFSSDGTWFHCNFEAKQDEDGKYCRKIFFAEILVDHYPALTETLTVTACHVLEAGKNTAGCGLCSDVLHPCQEFHKGYPSKYNFHGEFSGESAVN